MRLQIAYISPRRELKSGAAQLLVDDYVQRAARYMPVAAQAFRSEEALLDSNARNSGRSAPHVILLDSRGRALTSPEFAEYLGRQRDRGTQEIMLAIGPVDGWSPAARTRASLLLSLGAMTLPHELALAVLAEQVYRALTILAGHPYHSSHEIM